ncbi:MAG: hypothetical protein WCG96_08070 [Actinomycetes bacterium]
MTSADLSRLPSQLAEAVAGIEEALQGVEAKSHEARHLRNLRSALLPLAGRLAVAVAKADPAPAAFAPAALESTLRQASADIEALLSERQLAGPQARKLLEVRERMEEASVILGRLGGARRPGRPSEG